MGGEPSLEGTAFGIGIGKENDAIVAQRKELVDLYLVLLVDWAVEGGLRPLRFTYSYKGVLQSWGRPQKGSPSFQRFCC